MDRKYRLYKEGVCDLGGEVPPPPVDQRGVYKSQTAPLLGGGSITPHPRARPGGGGSDPPPTCPLIEIQCCQMESVIQLSLNLNPEDQCRNSVPHLGTPETIPKPRMAAVVGQFTPFTRLDNP